MHGRFQIQRSGCIYLQDKDTVQSAVRERLETEGCEAAAGGYAAADKKFPQTARSEGSEEQQGSEKAQGSNGAAASQSAGRSLQAGAVGQQAAANQQAELCKWELSVSEREAMQVLVRQRKSMAERTQKAALELQPHILQA
eukprot:3506285-Rhodomonas_salina.1